MEIKVIETELILQSHSGMNRAPGLHLSDVLDSLEEEVFKIKRPARSWGEGDTICMDTGFLFEEALSYAMSDSMAERLDSEVELDGILGSPDGIRFETDPWTLEEFKATWKSSNNRVEDNWRWLTQIKSYLWMIGGGMDTCILRVLYLNGNYKGSGPQYRAYELTFTEPELRSNWKMIKKEARRRGWIE